MKQVQGQVGLSVFCTVLMYNLTETQQRNYVLPGGGNTPILLLGSNCGVTSCSKSRPDSLYSNQKASFIYFCWAFTNRGRCAGKSKQINTVHLLSQISIIPNIWQLIPFMKFAVVPIYPICTRSTVICLHWPWVSDSIFDVISTTCCASMTKHQRSVSTGMKLPPKVLSQSFKKRSFLACALISVSEVTRHATTSLFLCSKMQRKCTAALISTGSYANGRVIFPSPHLAKHVFISPNTLKCGKKKERRSRLQGLHSVATAAGTNKLTVATCSSMCSSKFPPRPKEK